MSSFTRAESDWLRPPEYDDRAVYECCLCGEGIWPGEGMVCPTCLDDLTVREFASTVLRLTTTIACTD